MKYCDVRMNVMYVHIYHWHCDDVIYDPRTRISGWINEKTIFKIYIFTKCENFSFLKSWKYLALHMDNYYSLEINFHWY